MPAQALAIRHALGECGRAAQTLRRREQWEARSHIENLGSHGEPEMVTH
jgi:hypothetical protein